MQTTVGEVTNITIDDDNNATKVPNNSQVLNTIDGDNLSHEEEYDGESKIEDISNEKPDIASNIYISRKPRWWKRLAGRRGTAAQRKAIGRMTQQGYVLPKLCKYQHELNLEKVFQESPSRRAKAICPEEVLSPMIEDDSGSGDLHSNPANVAKHKDVCLEIGFGLGDNILTNAIKFPNRYFIGAEIHQPGVGIALMRMEKAIKTKTYWLDQTWFDESDKVKVEERQESRTSTDRAKPDDDVDDDYQPYDNLRIFAGDGIKLLGFLPDKSLDEIYLTFPDPWPQEQHQQWRVIQEETVQMIGRILKPSGRFYLATDAINFDKWTQRIFQTVQDKEIESKGSTEWEAIDPCPDRRSWLPAISKYEEKGVEEGRYTVCRCWIRT